MANAKISALTAATIPLDGTEVLPIVQSSTTKKVANNDLRPKQIQSNATSGVMQVAGPATAATRVMTIPDANFTVARTDAAQSFTGNQTFNNNIGVGGSPSGWSSLFSVAEFAGNAAIMSVNGLSVFNNAYYNGSDYIYKTTAAATRLLNGGGEWYWYRAASGTAGNAISFGTPKLTLDSSDNLTINVGNLIQGTAAKGINFTANTPAAGMTSQLLNWYEEGTWTVTWTSVTGTPSNTTGYYTRIGRVVTFSYAAGVNSLTGVAGTTRFTLPFNPGKYAAGSIASQLGTVSGSLEIDAGDYKAYPTAFSSAYMIFTGSYMI